MTDRVLMLTHLPCGVHGAGGLAFINGPDSSAPAKSLIVRAVALSTCSATDPQSRHTISDPVPPRSIFRVGSTIKLGDRGQAKTMCSICVSVFFYIDPAYYI
jgi:hypothetical protein